MEKQSGQLFQQTLETVYQSDGPPAGCINVTFRDDFNKSLFMELYYWRSKVQLSTKKVQLCACATSTKSKIGRSYVHKKAAKRAFSVGVGPSKFAFCVNGTNARTCLE